MQIATIRTPAAAALLLLTLAGCGPGVEATADAVAAATSASASADPHAGLLYGRVTTNGGDVYEGRLRWGGDEEALWSNYFNGFKRGNAWADHVEASELTERETLHVFGIEIPLWKKDVDLSRPFMVRFGDVARIEPRGKEIFVTLKSGAAYTLARYAADDLADGVRVWDGRRGVVDLDEWEIRSIEFGATPAAVDGPSPLYGTVRTRAGEFTGLIQWNRRECLETDMLDGAGPDGDVSIAFGDVRSIAKRSAGGAVVTLAEGREVVLSDGEVGEGNGGIYVDDARYGRVLVSWEAFERADFEAGAGGPGYEAFPAGAPLTGTVITRSGDRLAGRMVFDLDESETTETLDAPANGVDYTIPFRLVASIALPAAGAGGEGTALVTLRSGERLPLELTGDLGVRNGGVLIFVEGAEAPEYVSWEEVDRLEIGVPPTP